VQVDRLPSFITGPQPQINASFEPSGHAGGGERSSRAPRAVRMASSRGMAAPATPRATISIRGMSRRHFATLSPPPRVVPAKAGTLHSAVSDGEAVRDFAEANLRIMNRRWLGSPPRLPLGGLAANRNPRCNTTAPAPAPAAGISRVLRGARDGANRLLGAPDMYRFEWSRQRNTVPSRYTLRLSSHSPSAEAQEPAPSLRSARHLPLFSALTHDGRREPGLRSNA